MTTTKTPSKRPATAKAPQDRKPKTTKPEPAEGAQEAAEGVQGTTRTVTLDGVEVVVDLAPMTNVRLLRKMKRNDLGALLDFFELMFGADQLDALEERFGLDDVDDYNAFMARVMETINPNS